MLWRILEYQFEGIPGDFTLVALGLNTLKLIENHFERMVPNRISDINEFFAREVLPYKKDFPLYKDMNNLYKYAILHYLLKSGRFSELESMQLDRHFL